MTNSVDLAAAVRRLEAEGPARYPSRWSGLEVKGPRAIVYRVPAVTDAPRAPGAPGGPAGSDVSRGPGASGGSGAADGVDRFDALDVFDAFDAFVAEAAAGAAFEIRDAAHSLATLTDLADRIVTDLADWQARGVPIATIGARHDGTTVRVGSPDPDLCRRELTARYGTDVPLEVVEEAPPRLFA